MPQEVRKIYNQNLQQSGKKVWTLGSEPNLEKTNHATPLSHVQQICWGVKYPSETSSSIFAG